MAALLTPAELEALRPSVERAGIRRQDSEAMRYNFRRPDRISKEQMHALQFLHERCARNMSTSFSAYLRTTVSLAVSSVDQVTYEEFLRTIADPTAFYALGIAPFDDLGALEINPNVAFALIDRMLGGHGQATPVNRPLTEIEQNVVDSVVKLLLEGLAEAWKPVTNIAFSIRARETRPQMLQVAAANEGFVVVSFHVQVGDAGGGVNLCIPSGVVETASAQFQQAWPKQRREVNAQEREWIDDHLSRAPLLVVPMIRAKLSGSAALALKPGQVLTLPLSADRPIDVFVGGLKKMTGRLAAERGRVVVAVEDRAGRPVSRSLEKA
jgi:flagellar motor switch protein FliM